MNTLSTNESSAAEHIRITREILLERGTPAQPRALTRALNGDFVIAGSIGAEKSAWATRVDGDGKVQWRYLAPSGSKRREIASPEYSGVAILADDSVVLCGSKTIERGESESLKVGMLTHLDKGGRLLSEQLINPKGDKSFRLTNFHQCIATVDGTLVFGTGTRYWGDAQSGYLNQTFGLIVSLDAKGKITSEKLLEQPNGAVESVAALSNNDIAFVSNAAISNSDTRLAGQNRKLVKQISLIDPIGNNKGFVTLTGESIVLVQALFPDNSLRFMPAVSGTASLTTFDAQITNSALIKGRGKTIYAKRAYQFASRAIALFGYQEVETNVFSASICWLSADLNQSDHLLLPIYESIKIEDAVSTGKPGEFATVRQVLSSKRRSATSESRVGVILEFVQFQ